MRFALRPVLLLLPALAACAAPPPRCGAVPQSRDLATVDRLIAETRGNLDRGYRTVRDDGNASMNVCLGNYRHNIGMSFCTNPAPRTRAVTIDAASEERKLDALLARREALVREINAATAACLPPSVREVQ